jgi:uncharacterized SAM-binding protein YcdF (DUF218 family)
MNQRQLVWKRRGLFVGLAIMCFLAIGAMGLRRLGDWLVVQDSLQPASSVVVLGGQVPFRAMEAAEIYRKGWAHEVWLTRRADSPEDVALGRIGIEVASEDTVNQQVLLRFGVPKEAIRLLDKRVQNTADETLAIVQEMERISAHRVIIVSSKFHTRRVKALWRHLNDDRIAAIVRYTPGDPSDPDHWWRNSEDAMAVSREVFGLLNVWTGFPVRSGYR